MTVISISANRKAPRAVLFLYVITLCIYDVDMFCDPGPRKTAAKLFQRDRIARNIYHATQLGQRPLQPFLDRVARASKAELAGKQVEETRLVQRDVLADDLVHTCGQLLKGNVSYLSRRPVGSGYTKLIVALPLEIEKSVSDRDALSEVSRHGLPILRNDDAGDLFTVEYLHRTLEQPFLGKGSLGFENLQDSLQIRASRAIVDIRYADLLVDGELKMLDLGGEIEGRLRVNGMRGWRRRILRGVNGIGNGRKEAFLFGPFLVLGYPNIYKGILLLIF